MSPDTLLVMTYRRQRPGTFNADHAGGQKLPLREMIVTTRKTLSLSLLAGVAVTVASAGAATPAPDARLSSDLSCTGTNDALERYVCNDDKLKKVSKSLQLALQHRLTSLTAEQRAALLESQQSWLLVRLPYCGQNSRSRLMNGHMPGLSKCLIDVYSNRIGAINARCIVDNYVTIKDAIRGAELRPDTVPKGYVITGDIQSYKIVAVSGSTPLLSLPIHEIDKPQHTLAYLKTDGTGVALCSIRSQDGEEWLAQRPVEGPLEYIARDDTIEPH